MKIVADLDLCQGHAVCALEAPGVFEVPKRGQVEIVVESPAPDQLAQVRNAVAFCPTQALSIVEGEE